MFTLQEGVDDDNDEDVDGDEREAEEMMDGDHGLMPMPMSMSLAMASGMQHAQQQQPHQGKKGSSTTRIVRPIPLRTQSMKTPQHGAHGLQPLQLRPNQMIRQGSWSGQSSAPMMMSQSQQLYSGGAPMLGNMDEDGGLVMGYPPVRPHTTQPMDTPLARYSQINGQPMMMIPMMGQGTPTFMLPQHLQQQQQQQQQQMQHQQASGQHLHPHQQLQHHSNQDPFAMDGSVMMMTPRNPQTVHMDDLLPFNGMNAFGARSNSVVHGVGIGGSRPTSAFGQRMSVEEDFEEDDEDDRSTASPTDKMNRQMARSIGSGSMISPSQQQGMRPLSSSQQMRGLHHQQGSIAGSASVLSPTGTIPSRSSTPFSESNYEASIASTKMKKRAIIPPPPRTAASKRGARAQEEKEEDTDGSDDDDLDDDDDEGDEDVEEDDDDEHDSVLDAASPTARAQAAQGSPTRKSKGKDNKSSLKQTALLTSKNGKSAGTKKLKGEATVKLSKGKNANGLSAKASAALEKDKVYIPEGLPPPPRSTEKPSWSYAALIGQAILSSSRKRLALNQIYSWISAAYPYFKPGESGWMNSIRHNLSLNDCFIKGERNAEEKGGKGSVWMVEPTLEFQFKDGGFKKQQKARQVMPIEGDIASSASKNRKRKAGAGEEVRRTQSGDNLGTPIMHGTPLMINHEHLIQEHHMLECSPLPVDAPMMHKRPRLEKANTWATPMHLGSRPGSGIDFRRNSGLPGQSGFGDTDEEVGLTREQIANLKRLTGSPMVANAVDNNHTMLTDRDSPEDSFHHPHMIGNAPMPMAARLVQNGPQNNFNADDYTTPNRPLSSNPLHRPHLMSSSMMMPQLTPSASSPISSSPFPATATRPHNLDRRMMQMHDGSDSDDAVRIRQEDDRLSSDPAMPETIRKPYSIGLQPAPQLDGAFVIPAPPIRNQRPKTSPLETNLVSNTQTSSGNVLSPIIDRKPQKVTKTISLPGPGDLLSQSPRMTSDRNNSSVADALGHLDRLPRSPIGPSYSSSITGDGFATPMNPLSRHRTAGYTPRTHVINQLTTPSRNGAGIPHETPIGNVKLQFKAEHRLLDSPMGLPGSCYDLANHGYQVDWELEQMANRGSPTHGGCRRTEGEGVARTLFEVESGPFSDP